VPGRCPPAQLVPGVRAGPADTAKRVQTPSERKRLQERCTSCGNAAETAPPIREWQADDEMGGDGLEPPASCL